MADKDKKDNKVSAKDEKVQAPVIKKKIKKKIIKKGKENKYCNDNMGIDFNFDKVEADAFQE